jgi:hypothetical protein
LGKNQSEQSDLTTDKVLVRKVSLLSKMAETSKDSEGGREQPKRAPISGILSIIFRD